jgi:hypothetical protein
MLTYVCTVGLEGGYQLTMEHQPQRKRESKILGRVVVARLHIATDPFPRQFIDWAILCCRASTYGHIQ